MKLAQIPDKVLGSLRDSGLSDETIVSMRAKDLFISYCNYEGLINYGESLWNIVVKLRKEEAKCRQ